MSFSALSITVRIHVVRLRTSAAFCNPAESHPIQSAETKKFEMSSWLDTETKALLEESPPDKLAPASTARFTLVLIPIYRRNHRRLIRALKRVSNEPPKLSADSIVGRVPMTVERGLSHTDALVGQFELISCDAISVFLADGVVATASRCYEQFDKYRCRSHTASHSNFCSRKKIISQCASNEFVEGATFAFGSASLAAE